MNKEDRVEEVLGGWTNENVDKDHKYFVIVPDDDTYIGPYSKQNAIKIAKQRAQYTNRVYVVEAKIKLEVEPKMTVIK